MVVQHNITAMNSNRMLGVTTGAQAKSTEKLSSGYKINRAADDAAGLAISEKMRKQIRGLSQASDNAQDGISAVQTAEGALGEVHDMLQRMNELAVKSANGTNSTTDRDAIQAEIDQITTEIDRVAETTKFNETYLLKGDSSAVKGFSYAYSTMGASIKADRAAEVKMATNAATGINMKITFSATASSAAQNAIAIALRDQGISVKATSEWSSVTSSGTKKTYFNVALNGTVAQEYTIVSITSSPAVHGAAASAKYQIQDASGHSVATFTITGYKSTATTRGSSVTDTVNLYADSGSKITAAANKADRVQYFDKDGNKISQNALGNYFGVTAGATKQAGNGTTAYAAVVSGAKLYDAVGNELSLKSVAKTVVATQDQTAALKFSLQVGADGTDNNKIAVNIDAMTAKGLGVNGLKVDGNDGKNATDAIETIKAAIQKVSGQRSNLGAVQNRLEHTIKNLDNVVENTTAAESLIRDTDMADEMVTYSKNNILAQAGQSMLAQANQSNQGALSLLG